MLLSVNLQLCNCEGPSNESLFLRLPGPPGDAARAMLPQRGMGNPFVGGQQLGIGVRWLG